MLVLQQIKNIATNSKMSITIILRHFLRVIIIFKRSFVCTVIDPFLQNLRRFVRNRVGGGSLMFISWVYKSTSSTQTASFSSPLLKRNSVYQLANNRIQHGDAMKRNTRILTSKKCLMVHCMCFIEYRMLF